MKNVIHPFCFFTGSNLKSKSKQAKASQNKRYKKACMYGRTRESSSACGFNPVLMCHNHIREKKIHMCLSTLGFERTQQSVFPLHFI